jgi:hypothetical protein
MRVHEGLDRYRYTPQYMGPGNERVRGSGPAMDVLMCRRNLELQRASSGRGSGGQRDHVGLVTTLQVTDA